MLEKKDFTWNQYAKIHELDCEKNPLNYYFYSNGIHFLCINRTRDGFSVCGLNTGFYVKKHTSDFDIYETFNTLLDAVKCFEQFINLLLFKRRFDDNKNFDERKAFQNELF